MTHRLAYLVLLLMLASGCRSGAIEINVRFAQMAGLAKGDRVLFQHNLAGSIEGVTYAKDGTCLAKLKIAKGFANSVTQYAQFRLIDDPDQAGRKAVEIRLLRQDGKPLKSGTEVAGILPELDPAMRFRKDLQAGVDFLKKQINKFSGEIQRFPESEAYGRLKQSLEALADEIDHAGKEARDKIRDQWLPQIQRELEELKEQMRKFGREEELRPLEEHVQRIRRI